MTWPPWRMFAKRIRKLCALTGHHWQGVDYTLCLTQMGKDSRETVMSRQFTFSVVVIGLSGFLIAAFSMWLMKVTLPYIENDTYVSAFLALPSATVVAGFGFATLFVRLRPRRMQILLFVSIWGVMPVFVLLQITSAVPLELPLQVRIAGGVLLILLLSMNLPVLADWLNGSDASAEGRIQRVRLTLGGFHFLGLLFGNLAYALVIEPSFTLAGQAYIWLVMATLVATFTMGSGINALKFAVSGAQSPRVPFYDARTLRRCLRWAFIAFCSTGLAWAINSVVRTEFPTNPTVRVYFFVLQCLAYARAFIASSSRPTGFALFLLVAQAFILMVKVANDMFYLHRFSQDTFVAYGLAVVIFLFIIRQRHLMFVAPLLSIIGAVLVYVGKAESDDIGALLLVAAYGVVSLALARSVVRDVPESIAVVFLCLSVGDFLALAMKSWVNHWFLSTGLEFFLFCILSLAACVIPPPRQSRDLLASATRP